MIATTVCTTGDNVLGAAFNVELCNEGGRVLAGHGLGFWFNSAGRL